jgi:ZIP family zinc transporter
MLYVSLIEIWVKSQLAFEEAEYSAADAYLLATSMFFTGIVCYKLLDALVHCLEGRGGGGGSGNHATASATGAAARADNVGHFVEPALIAAALKHADDADELKEQAEENKHTVTFWQSPINTTTTTAPPATTILVDLEANNDGESDSSSSSSSSSHHSKKQLHRTGLMVALSIGLHNAPEGLATFVAALDDLSVGMALAIAIALHNIPEGVCVSVPILYSSGSRCKAFWWGVLSGASEPVAAALGWVLLRNHFTQTAYGILFGLVSGMMTQICMAELIPTALKYDKDKRYVANAVCIGMAVMAVSLVLFTY